MAIELDDRRKALEDAFFQKENDAALQKIREHRENLQAEKAQKIVRKHGKKRQHGQKRKNNGNPPSPPPNQ